jgi:cytosine/adenosine deaminase-related metal-dependent hydrolase
MTAVSMEFKDLAPRNLVLNGARVARSSQIAQQLTVETAGRLIKSLDSVETRSAMRPAATFRIDLTGYMILPGLINAHDHLDFSLYPQLGNGPYPSWREWAADIYRPHESPIKELLELSRDVRIWWGGIRNLLCGATTVSQHDRYMPEVLGRGFPVHVPAEYGWAHSMADANNVAERFHGTPANWPFLIHLAEGTNAVAASEFPELSSTVELNPRIALVHAVGLTERHWETVLRLNLGVVWCPLSNLFTLGQTLGLKQIQSMTNVALGTDSPLTAAGDLLDHIRFLHQAMRVPPALLYLLVTTRAARLLRLGEGQGRLEPDSLASMMVVRDRHATPAHTLVELDWTDVELVIQAGRIVLASPALVSRLPDELTSHLESLCLDGVERLIDAPSGELVRQTTVALGSAFSLWGRQVELKRGESRALTGNEFATAG